VETATCNNVEAAMADLKQVMDSEEVDAIKAKSESLTQASHKLAEAMYQQTAQCAPEAETSAQDAAVGAKRSSWRKTQHRWRFSGRGLRRNQGKRQAIENQSNKLTDSKTPIAE
jgi:hypothetical protein